MPSSTSSTPAMNTPPPAAGEPAGGPKTVLVVEDEPDVLDLVAFHLERGGYQVLRAATGAAARDKLRRHPPDLVILDLMLPDLSGLEILKELARQRSDLPVIILSARTTALERVQGLELGAADYVPKPFSPRELVLRVRAVLARTGGGPEGPLQLGALTIDRAGHRVAVDGVGVKLTATEFRLLTFLIDHPSRVHERDRMLDLVWGSDVFVGPRTIDAHVANLRGKLGRAGEMIETVRGFGYRFIAPSTAGKSS